MIDENQTIGVTTETIIGMRYQHKKRGPWSYSLKLQTARWESGKIIWTDVPVISENGDKLEGFNG